MLGIITVSKSGLLKLINEIFFMYEKNLLSQFFPRVNHSLRVRKFIGKSSMFFRHLGAALFSKYYLGGWGCVQKTNSSVLGGPS